MPRPSVHEVAKHRALTMLDTNNANNRRSDSIIAVLEAGDGSLYLREKFAVVLHQIATAAIHGRDDELWANMQRCLSLKEKLAYIVGELHENNGGATRNVVSQADLALELDTMIDHFQEKVVDVQDVKESWILRHAAFNRFACKCDTKEKAKISQLAVKIKTLAQGARAVRLAESMDFQQESDAQRIGKLDEAIQMLTQANVAIPDDIIQDATALVAKIQPLKDLDVRYHHMAHINSMTMEAVKSIMPDTNNRNRADRSGMPLVRQQKKVKAVLKDLGKKEEDFIIQPGSSDTVQSYLTTLKARGANMEALQAALVKNRVDIKYFEPWFISYFCFYNKEHSSKELQDAKHKAFGNEGYKMFEMDVNHWRGAARERVMAVAPYIQPNGTLVGDNLNLVSNYFDKFKTIFSIDPEANPAGFHDMRAVIAAMIRTRVPGLPLGNQNFRPLMSRILRFTTLGRRGNRYNNAYDDAEIIATLIMAQAHGSQQDFYTEREKDLTPHRRFRRWMHGISRTELVRRDVVEAIKPGVRGFGRLVDGAARLTLKGVGYAIAGVTKGAAVGLGKLNKTMEKSRKRYVKIPYAATWLAERASTLVNRGAIGSIKGAGKLYDKGVAGIIDISGDKEVKALSDGILKVGNKASQYVAQPVSRGAEQRRNLIDTNQKRDLVSSFMQLAMEDNNIAEIMRSTQLADMLNFRDSGAYLFDHDGRTQPIDIESEAKPDNTPDGANKNLATVLDKQSDGISEGLKKDIDAVRQSITAARTAGDAAKEIQAMDKQREMLAMHTHIRDIIARLRAAKAGLGANFTPASVAAITTLSTQLDTLIGTAPTFNAPNQQGQVTINVQGTGILQQIGVSEMNRDNAAARVQALQGIITTQNGIVQANQRPNNNNNNNNNNAQTLATALAALATAQQELPAQEKIRDANDALLRTRRPYVDYLTMIQGQMAGVNTLMTDVNTAVTNQTNNNNAQTTQAVADASKALNEYIKTLDLSLPV